MENQHPSNEELLTVVARRLDSFNASPLGERGGHAADAQHHVEMALLYLRVATRERKVA